MPTGGPGACVMPSGALEGDTVVGPGDADLGRLDRIMIDLASGRVAYAVLACGGVCGIGERHYRVPWDQLHLDPRRQCFVLEGDPRSLRAASRAEML